MTVRVAILSMAAVLILSILCAFALSEADSDPLSGLSGASRVNARVYFESGGANFMVPLERWPAVLRILQPAKYEDGMNWIVLGQLDVQKADGGTATIDLFQPRGRCAFRIDGKYYRGGPTHELVGELEKAWLAYSSSDEQGIAPEQRDAR